MSQHWHAQEGVKMFRVAESKPEIEELADILDGEHNDKENVLMVASILDESALTSTRKSSRPHSVYHETWQTEQIAMNCKYGV